MKEKRGCEHHEGVQGQGYGGMHVLLFEELLGALGKGTSPCGGLQGVGRGSIGCGILALHEAPGSWGGMFMDDVDECFPTRGHKGICLVDE